MIVIVVAVVAVAIIAHHVAVTVCGVIVKPRSMKLTFPFWDCVDVCSVRHRLQEDLSMNQKSPTPTLSEDKQSQRPTDLITYSTMTGRQGIHQQLAMSVNENTSRIN